MKKIITSILAAALLCSMSVTAFAASPIEAVNGTDSAPVKGTYKSGATADTVYSVDIAWGSMAFTYTAGSEGVWNPETHAYTGVTTGAWSCTADANKITVTNHSNTAIDATISYTKEAAYSAIGGSFADGEGYAITGAISIPSAVGYAVASAPEAYAFLKLDGALSDGVTNTKIGTVTVTITEQSGNESGEAGL